MDRRAGILDRLLHDIRERKPPRTTPLETTAGTSTHSVASTAAKAEDEIRVAGPLTPLWVQGEPDRASLGGECPDDRLDAIVAAGCNALTILFQRPVSHEP